GVMRFLAERGVGFPTAGGPVPIVPTACVFDLAEHGNAVPGPDEGFAAAAAADADTEVAVGRVGAGRGATVGKWRGREHAVPGGVGVAGGRDGDVVIGALVVVNAIGDVIGADGRVLAGSTAPEGTPGFADPLPFDEGQHTTL